MRMITGAILILAAAVTALPCAFRAVGAGDVGIFVIALAVAGIAFIVRGAKADGKSNEP
jgi:hypothetical protein